mmetsp:Transcript_100376/g.288360  ORF Transcript_100376/g.288360 Transcript_100376/m.288360 type:complete len:233 (+) Transcript_100376:2356-3054(+)
MRTTCNLRLTASLRLHQVGVFALRRHQLGVRALLDALAGLDDKDLVRVPDGRQPVGDGDGREAVERGALQCVQGRLHTLLGLVVQGRGRLVEQQQLRFLRERARDRHALLLPSGQLAAADADEGVQLLGQGVDELPGLRLLDGLFRLLLGDVGVATLDVLEDRRREEHRLLTDIPDEATPGAQRQRLEVHAIDRHDAGHRVVEALQELDDRGLARAALADEGHLLTLVDCQA